MRTPCLAAPGDESAGTWWVPDRHPCLRHPASRRDIRHAIRSDLTCAALDYPIPRPKNSHRTTTTVPGPTEGKRTSPEALGRLGFPRRSRTADTCPPTRPPPQYGRR
jgi:hypothetical protein